MNPFAAISSAPHLVHALLVDRDSDTRKMYAECLRLAACDIDEATDGREALAKAFSNHPDIIVTETRLAGIDGYQLCSLLRRDTATQAIPIIVVTGDAYPADVARAQRAGADAVLVKPCLPDRLLAEMRHALERSRQPGERAAQIPGKAANQAARTNQQVERSSVTRRKYALSRAYRRHTTTTPPTAPPALVCPVCDRPLIYLRSHVGGVSERHPEQWDYLECSAGCGTFQYRERTRKLRKVS